VILVDTNVWMYSAGAKHPAITQRLRALLLDGAVRAHDFVYGELLLMPGGSARKAVVDRYRDLDHLPVLPNDAVNTFIIRHNLAGKGVGLVDVHLLASVHAAGAKLWTEEKAAKAVSRALGIAYGLEKQ
jgi:predicted nucleic acid-binding protein